MNHCSANISSKNRLFYTGAAFCLFLLAIGCQKVSPELAQTLDGEQIRILGHAGAGFPGTSNRPPINSRESVLKAIEGWNADGVEIDVQMSEDSTLWLYHDGTLATQTNCQGCVYDRPSEELKECRYRKVNGVNIGGDDRLIPLTEILDRFRQRKIQPLIYLDIKDPFNCPLEEAPEVYFSRMARALNRAILRYNDEEKVLLETSNSLLMRSLLNLSPRPRIVYRGRPGDNIEALLANYDLYGLGFNYDVVSREQLIGWHDRGLRVVLWDVSIRKAAIEAAEKSPDFIITNNIPLLQAVIR